MALIIAVTSVVMTLTLQTSQGFYHQPTFLDPVYDKYGFEIAGDRILEMTAMKSTSLGYGQGFNYSNLQTFTPYTPPIVPPYLVRPNFPQVAPPRPGQVIGYSVGQSSYAPPQTQSPAPNYRSPHNGPTKYTPFQHRRFKRQARFPGNEPSQNFFNHLARAPLNLEFGPQLDFGPSGGNFISEPFARDPFTDTSLPNPEQGTQTSKENSACQREQTITCNRNSRYRTVDGLCNNLANPKWGATMQPLLRLHRNYYYYDGIDVPRMTSATDPRRLLPSPRLVSRLVHEPDRDGQKIAELTNLIQQWGQFLDHDITGTPAHKGPDGRDLKCCDNVYLSEERQIHSDVFNGGVCNPIYIPPLDRHFRYSCMNFARSQAAPRRSDCDERAPKQPREQMNILTAFIDGSQIYGSTLKSNRAIRLYRHGMLKVTELDLLPEDKNSTCVKDHPGDYCFKAGETRVNEHPALASIHTIFHRLHNKMAVDLLRVNPRWSDEKVFQEVRKIMGAILQHVTFHDWLPIILGYDVMGEYSLTVSGPLDSQFNTGNFWSYDITTNPTILNEFATAAFRFGHTLIPSSFTVGSEKIRLHRMFNRPSFVLKDRGESVGKFCSGLMEDAIQHFDRFISTDLSDRLFEDKDNVSMDLAALNIQRGRDHGLPGYNEYREICGLGRYKNFDDLYQEDPDRAEVFRRVYDHVDDIDLFPGGVSERPLPGATVGPTFACLLGKQFRSLKFGDRYWYESGDESLAFTPEQLRDIKSYPLSKALCSSAPLSQIIVNPFYKNGAFLPRPVRLVTGEIVTQNREVNCQDLADIDMRSWLDPEAQSRGK